MRLQDFMTRVTVQPSVGQPITQHQHQAGSGQWTTSTPITQASGTLNGSQNYYLTTGQTSQSISYSIAKPEQQASIDFTDDQILISFVGLNANTIKVIAELDIDTQAVSALDSIRLNQLVSAIIGVGASGGTLAKFNPIAFIERYNLERHFKFTAA